MNEVVKRAYRAGQEAQMKADGKRLGEKLRTLNEIKGIGPELHKRIVAHFAKEEKR
ncbi:hypothetical protein [Ectobacillus antri]|uniref:hypothetical protein n=1 Tax=Ectobacillus antri TaxID=2486280 RepID=UPI0013DE4F68|nr:hypothetical protein [Ectobacillus antri]